MKYWIMKTEPNVFSIDDLKNLKVDHWEGIRNYQARNFMRDQMKKGDGVLIYHSNCKPPGVVGVAVVDCEAYSDFTALDKKSKYYYPKATEEENPWMMVDVRYVRHLKKEVSLDEMKNHRTLEKMNLLQRGNRLSIMEATKKEYEYILKLGGL